MGDIHLNFCALLLINGTYRLQTAYTAYEWQWVCLNECTWLFNKTMIVVRMQFACAFTLDKLWLDGLLHVLLKSGEANVFWLCMMDDERPIKMHYQTNEMQICALTGPFLTLDIKTHYFPCASQVYFTIISKMKAAPTEPWQKTIYNRHTFLKALEGHFTANHGQKSNLADICII